MKNTNPISLLFLLSLLAVTNPAWSGQLSPTIYYIKTIDLGQKCDSKKSIYAVDGKVLFKVCAAAYKSCVIEGTCAIELEGPDVKKDNSTEPSTTPGEIQIEGDDKSTDESEIDFEVINYVKMGKDGRPLFVPVDENKCPWGYGVSQICLDPYFTVAADLQFHKAGEVIFVDKLKGVKLPTGETHDGFLIVRDRGGAIKGADRFDFYTGMIAYKDEKNPFTPLGFASKTNKMQYRKATSEEADRFRKERNFPGIPH